MMYYLCQLSFDINNIFQPDIFGEFLGFLIRKHKNINQIIAKLLIETLLKNRAVKVILEFFLMMTNLMVQEYSSSKSIKLLTF